MPEGQRKKRATFHLSPWILERLREEPGSQGRLIEEALVKAYKWRAK